MKKTIEVQSEQYNVSFGETKYILTVDYFENTFCISNITNPKAAKDEHILELTGFAKKLLSLQ